MTKNRYERTHSQIEKNPKKGKFKNMNPADPQMSYRRTQSSGSRPRSRADSAVVQFEDPDTGTACGVSECWSPNSEEAGIHHPGSRSSMRRQQQQRLVNPSRSRPMGGIEKVIEYRQIPNGGGTVEVRRVTPSVDGPVEHIDVVEPVHLDSSSVRGGSRTSPRKWRSSLRDKSSSKRPSSSASIPAPGGSRGAPSPTRTPWLDFEGPPAQQHAAIWNANSQNGGISYRKLAMNGSQPCLMVMTSEPPPPMNPMQMQHPDQNFHHFYNPHIHPAYNDHYIHASFLQDGFPVPNVHGGFVGPQYGRLAGSQPCLYLNSDSNLQFVQAQKPHEEAQLHRKSSGRSSQRGQSRSGLKRSESFSVPTSRINPPPPPPPDFGPIMDHCDDLKATPSMSPLEVVRNKRASQANWEREHRQRRASNAGVAGTPEGEGSSVDSILSCGPPKSALSFGVSKLSTPILRSGSCTRIFPDSEEDGIETGDDDCLPPPPSPPCTCGKNLELPPTPPPMGMDVHHSSKSGHRGHSHHHHHHHYRGHGQRGEANGGLHSSKLNINGSTAYLMENIEADGGPHSQQKEKEVSFANCTVKSSSSPSSPAQQRFPFPTQADLHSVVNNEAYPCDCCRLDDQYYPNQIHSSTGRHQFDECLLATNGVSTNGISHRMTSSSESAKYEVQVKSPKMFRAKLIETERGISLEFGKFVALISFSGVRFRRQHWCLLSVILLIIVLSIAIGLPLSGDDLPLTPEERIAVVKQLLKEVPLIDGHNDLPWNIRKFIHNKLHLVNFTTDLRMVKPWSDSVWSHTDLYRMSQGNIGGQFWVAYAPCGSQHKDAVQVTLEQIDLIKRFIGQYPKLQFVNDSTGIFEAHADNRIASLISIESGHSIGTSLAVLRMFHRLGAISLTLTHNCNTPWADCSNVDKPGGTPEHNGLSKFGKTVIKELNRLGMIIDLSHSSHATSKDTIQTSEAPVIFSHSSAFSICNSTRNVRDDVLKLLAKKNGLVMVNFFSYFLTCSNKSSINDVVAHLNHLKKVAGVDHVGIGASYDGINAVPAGLEDVSKYPELFATLLASGMWSIEDLKKLAGLNFLRVFKEVERVSQRLRQSLLGPSEDHIDGQLIKDYIGCRSVAKRDANFTAC